MSARSRSAQPRYVDARGPRFGAAATAVVLAAVVVTGSGALLAVQTGAFLVGAVAGLAYSPYGRLFGVVKRVARLGPPAELEAEAPPRFAQAVGAVFGLVGTAGYVSGAATVGTVAASFALLAALLNAVFGLCLGCEVYLISRRVLNRAAPPRFIAPSSKGAAA